MTEDEIDMVEERDGKFIGFSASNPSVTYPVILLDVNGDETNDIETAIGGVVSFAEDRHQIFNYAAQH